MYKECLKHKNYFVISHLLNNTIYFYLIVMINTLKKNVGYGKMGWGQVTKRQTWEKNGLFLCYTILFFDFPYLISYHTLDFCQVFL